MTETKKDAAAPKKKDAARESVAPSLTRSLVWPARKFASGPRQPNLDAELALAIARAIFPGCEPSSIRIELEPGCPTCERPVTFTQTGAGVRARCGEHGYFPLVGTGGFFYSQEQTCITGAVRLGTAEKEP